MPMNINLKLYFLLLTIFLIFYLSCEDADYPTIFEDDNESGKLWKDNTNVDPDRILKFGHNDNFWEMGETGPCGPCTEIHYYSGDDPESQSADGVNVLDDYREIWNLVLR